MIEQDYVDFCNAATDLCERAEAFFADLEDEHVFQLDGLVRSEIAACPSGKVSPGYDFLAAILAQEVAERRNPTRNVVRMPSKPTNEIPF